MDTGKLKRFAQNQRRSLIAQIGARLDYLLTHDDEYLRAHDREKKQIQQLYEIKGREDFLEEVAYIWFNRITALRYMDLRSFNKIKIVSPAAGESQMQILSEIKQGRFPKWLSRQRREIEDLLDGKIPSDQPDREIYRRALLAYCNEMGNTMPFLFETLHDWSALLLPGDILSSESFIAEFQKNLTEEECQSVEVIGWLYQFYISEKKDAVFAALQKNVKIAKENIPAATQLFTPNWIVRYMVDNSLGRLWLSNRPQSRLAEKMEYYIPSDEDTDPLKISGPEEIKLLDPACGSGHILVYAFDLLYKIYEESGYDADEIPRLILEKNLYGMDIDGRAASLSAFALTMKAREKDRFFFTRDVVPHIVTSREVHVDLKNLNIRVSPSLQTSLEYLKEAKNLGSLVPVEVGLENEIWQLRESLSKTEEGLFHAREKEDLLAGLEQIEILQPRYHCVIANPPYMGGKGMNNYLKDFLGKYYTDYKSDLFSAFIVRNLNLTLPKGQLGFMTPFVWMFISSYEKLRLFIIDSKTITSLVQLEYSGFDGATVPICTFTLENYHRPKYKGGFVRLSDFKGAENQGPKALEIISAYKESLG